MDFVFAVLRPILDFGAEEFFLTLLTRVIGMGRWLEMSYYSQPAITRSKLTRCEICSKLTIKIMTLF